MQYFGGKSRIAKPLSEFLNGQLREGQPFVDLFCGSCNVVSKINPDRRRIANDLHYELIALFRYLQDGGQLPDHISEEQYRVAMHDPRLWYRAFVGFGCSFAGIYFGGYARSGSRNYASGTKNSLLKKIGAMHDVEFYATSYYDAPIPSGALVYCDIPYKNARGYTTGDFDHETFYKWTREETMRGSRVYVSEYKGNQPPFADVVWEYASRKSIRNSDGEQVATTEILWTPSTSKIQGM